MPRRFRIPFVLLLALVCSLPLRGQNASPDSVFRLVQAERAEQYEKYGMHYRLVKGHARFLHNDTYLLCDSASWNVDSKFIEAFGNVQIIQNKTMLKSEQMDYWIDESRAVFRGPLVELYDKDGNTLRTEKLTYNTKDSLAVFDYGGALKDKDGNVIESLRGEYDGKEGLFTFQERVELYMDSIEIRSQSLKYHTESEQAEFGRNTYTWREDGFVRADGGGYDRAAGVVRYSNHVFMFNPSYEAWADEAYYRQSDGAADLWHNAQVVDTTNKSIYTGDHIQYIPPTDSLSERGLMTGNPAIIYYGENEDHVVDTLYVRADTFFVYAVPRCDIPQQEFDEAAKRLEDITFDALGKKRREEAAAREKERLEKMRAAGKLPPEWVEQQKQAEADSLAALARLDSLVTVGAVDSLMAASDSLRASREAVQALLAKILVPPADTTAVKPAPPADSTGAVPGVADSTGVVPGALDSTGVKPPRDTTPVRYVKAWLNVRLFRSDLQAVCDSVVFCELDSIARLYGKPVLWNEVRNQLSAEEMQLLMRGGTFERGSMITNAWLISKRDSSHFDQIKSTEMQGWFRDNKLYRFDALGGVSAIFYMAEDDVITTINVKEAKSMTAAMKNATAQRLLYTESVKSDAYPVGELVPEKQRLKEFKWRGDERPASREDITTAQVRKSERSLYEDISKPLYRETNKYFDNYMFNLFEKINAEKKAELERRQAEQDSLARVTAQAEADSLAAARLRLMEDLRDEGQERDSLSPLVVPVQTTDTTVVKAVPVADSTAVNPVPSGDLTPVAVPFERVDKTTTDVSAPASPETVERSQELTRAERRALRRAERQARREARRAAREARRAARAAAREAARAAKN